MANKNYDICKRYVINAGLDDRSTEMYSSDLIGTLSTLQKELTQYLDLTKDLPPSPFGSRRKLLGGPTRKCCAGFFLYSSLQLS